jgi:serine/threonine protein kinase/thioredoxin-like negative regulator of GroEL
LIVATRTKLRSPSAIASIDAALSAVRGFSRSAWLDLVRRDQCERWRSGGRAGAESYFDLLPELRADREDMLVLICGEMQLRKEAGDAFTLDEYQHRFPDLAAEIAVQHDIDQFLPREPDLANAEDAPVEIPNWQLAGYEILRELGRGAAGIIYLARQASTNRLVAVKAIALSATDAQRLVRQRQEASILSRLQHPHVVQIYDVIEIDGMLYLIIEYVNGLTLLEFTAGKPQPPKEAARLARTLAEAIHVVHEAGILHRDLKPSNILLTSLGDPKITDFGLAKLLSSDAQLTTDNCLLGTPCYMPPEQASANGRIAGREGDVYSLGAILYELLTGRPPFVGVTILDTLSLIRDRDPIPCRTLQPKTPRDLETICLKCLEKAPQRRYATAAALAADLERFLQGSTIEARRPSWREKTERWCRRKPGIAILAASLALTIVGSFFGILWQWDQAESARQNESNARRDADQRATEIQQGSERLRAALALEDRGHIFWGLRRWDDAINALDAAIALCHELGSAWEERGQIYTDLGLWDLAVGDRRRAFEFNKPAMSDRWWSYGTLLAQSGDLDGYHRLCTKMHERFRGHGGRIAADFVRTACLIPGIDTDYKLAAARLQAGQFHDPLYLYAQGLVLYRAGEFRHSVACCLESLSAGYWNGQPLNFPVLALAYAKLGDPDNARTYLERATQARDRWIENLYSSGEKNWVTHKGVSAEWQVSPFDWLEFNLLYNEARVQLNQPKLTDDPRLAALRARAFAAIRRFDEADAEYKAAVALAPNDHRIGMEQHRCKAYRCVQENDFGRAAGEFAKATQLDPDDIRLWVSQAQAQLAAGNIEAYRRVCGEMLQRHRSMNDPATADRLVWTCVNRADSLPNMEDLLPLADLALAGYPGAARTKGAALVRAGRDEEALRSFDASSRINAPHPADMCFQAIACCHLGRIKQSKQHLDDAARWIALADRWKLPDVELTEASWANLGWDERLEALRLREEAETLLASHQTAR